MLNGSDIGKEYSAKALLEKLTVTERPISQEESKRVFDIAKTDEENAAREIKKSGENPSLLNDLLHSEKQDGYVPYQFRRGKRKKSKR